MSNSPTFLTPAQAGELFASVGLSQFHKKWVTDRIDRGLLPCTKINNRRYVLLEVIEALIKEWVGEAGGDPKQVTLVSPEAEEQALEKAARVYKQNAYVLLSSA